MALQTHMTTHLTPSFYITKNHEKHADPPTPKAWRDSWTTTKQRYALSPTRSRELN